MLKLSFVFGLLASFLWVVCLVLLRYCISGFWGYPDVWTSEKARKAYTVCAPMSMILLLVALIIIFTTI